MQLQLSFSYADSPSIFFMNCPTSFQYESSYNACAENASNPQAYFLDRLIY
ncbi:hypothetical protein BRYFOR_05567 [Marvinbryantia formatexigens DSM 14469]|uniref:Uncharacterized protein n=1 Tax=Marvinbryantia formatexigens DSM 14469 TaxID=478749 RepID=C6LAC6_9FIRM|nr:hypothetical protein BRYFOR_05567 [Marvinbryantia formatexigens DSM 14469]